MKNNSLFTFTGGPGSGKTTLLESLHKKGFTVVEETARKIIKQRLHAGLPPRPAAIDFAIQIFQNDLNNYLAHSDADSLVFFDRSHVDSASMISEADPAVYAYYEKHVSEKRFNSVVFTFPPWEEIYKTDGERDQSFSDAIRIFHKLSDWYKMQGYDVLEVPKCTLEERAEFVLSQAVKYLNGP